MVGGGAVRGPLSHMRPFARAEDATSRYLLRMKASAVDLMGWSALLRACGTHRSRLVFWASQSSDAERYRRSRLMPPITHKEAVNES